MTDTSTMTGLSRVSGRAPITQAHIRDVNYSIAISANPWLANAPDALASIADSGLDPYSISAQAGALAGIEHTDELLQSIRTMSDVGQRAVYSRLTEQQQRALDGMGYRQPEKGSWTDFFDPVTNAINTVAEPIMAPVKTVVAPALGIGLDILAWGGDVAGHFYRSIRQMEGWQQWLALGGAALAVVGTGGLALGATAGVLGAGSLATAGAAASGFLSGAAGLAGTMGTVGALGATALGGAMLATAPTAITNPNEWWNLVNPFGSTGVGRGERIFTADSQARARDILGGAEHLGQIAADIAAEMDMYDLVADFAGVRDATNMNVLQQSVERVAEQYAEVGSTQYEQVYGVLQKLLNETEFRQAIDELQGGKISFGRDVASLAGLQEGDQFYGVVSGAMDGMWLFAMDPFIAAGTVGKAMRLHRRGLSGVMADQNVMERLGRILNEDQTAGAMVDQLMDAVAMNRYDMVPKNWRPNFFHMKEYERGLRAQGKTTFGREEFMSYIEEGNGLRRMLEGKGTLQGHEQLILDVRNASRGRGRLQNQLRNLKEGMTDVEMDRALSRAMRESGGAFDTRTASQRKADLAKGIDRVRPVGNDDQPVEWTWEAVAMTDDERRAVEGSVGYQVGRAMGTILKPIPTGKSINRFIASITQMIPPGQALNLVGDQASDDIARFINTMGIHFNVRATIRRDWVNTALAQGTVGQRRQVLLSYMDSLWSVSGIKQTREGRELIDNFTTKYKQSYGYGGLDHLKVKDAEAMRVVGYLPDVHQAVMFVMPNLREVQKLVRRGLFLKHAARVLDSQPLEAAMSRVIKPGWLLRIGFIPRAAGEEFLAFAFRATEMALVQSMGARSVAMRRAYEQAYAKRALNGVESLTKLERQALKYELPTHVRPLMAMSRRLGFEDPVNRFLNSYGVMLRNRLQRGLGFRQLNSRNPWLDTLLMGRSTSWRRMIASGYDPALQRQAESWVIRHSNTMLKATSALNASQFDTAVVRPDATTITMRDPHKNRDIEVPVALTGEYERIGTGSDRYAASVHERAEMWRHDNVVGPTYSVGATRLWPKDPTLNKVEWVDDLVQIERNVQTHAMKAIVGELLVPRYDNGRAAATQLTRIDPVAGRALQAATENGSVDIDKVIDHLHGHVASVLAKNEVTSIAGIKETKLRKQLQKYSDMQLQLKSLRPTLDRLNAMDGRTRQWYAATMSARMHGVDFDIPRLRAWAEGKPMSAVPEHIYYRGVPTPDTFYVDDQGNLWLKPQTQTGWNVAAKRGEGHEIKAISLTTSPTQALSFANINRGSRELLPRNGGVLAIDGRAVQTPFNRTHDQIAADAHPRGHRPSIGRDEARAISVGWGDGVSNEISIGIGADHEWAEGFMVPAGQWRMLEGSEMDRIADDWIDAGMPNEHDLQPLPTVKSSEIQVARGQVQQDFTSTLDRWLDDMIPLERNALMELIGDHEIMVEAYLQEKYGRAFGPDGMDDWQDHFPLLEELLLEHPVLGPNFRQMVWDAETSVGPWSRIAEDMLGDFDAVGYEQLELSKFLTKYVGGEDWWSDSKGRDFWFRVNAPSTSFHGNYNRFDALTGKIEDFHGMGQWGPGEVQMAPMFEDVEEWERWMASEIAGQLMLPQNQQYLRLSDHMATTPDGRPVATPPPDGINYLYTPMAPTQMTQVSEVLTNRHKTLEEFHRDPYVSALNAVRNAFDRPQAMNPDEMRERLAILHRDMNVDAMSADDIELVEQLVDGLDDLFTIRDNRIAQVYQGLPPQGGSLARRDEISDEFYQQVYPAWINDNVEKVEALIAATRIDETWAATAQRLLDRHHVRGYGEEINEILDITEQRKVLARVLRLMDAEWGVWSQPATVAFPKIAFDDPRISRWITQVLSDTPVEDGATKVGMLSIPRPAASGLGAWHDGVRLGGVFETGSRTWQLDDRYATMVTPLEARDVKMIPGEDWVNPISGRTNPTAHFVIGVSFNEAVDEYARLIMQNLRLTHRRGMREAYKVREDSPVKLMRRIEGESWQEIEPGTRIEGGADVFEAKPDGTPGTPIPYGDQRFFDIDHEVQGDDLMWGLLGPMMRDAFEEKDGFARRVPKPYRTKTSVLTGTSTRVPIDEDTVPDELVMMTRSRVEDVAAETASDLPNVAVAEKYRMIPNNLWDRMVRYGFDNVIGPSIDALARKPMTFHYYRHAYEENSNQMIWMLDKSLWDEQLPEAWGGQLAMLDAVAQFDDDTMRVWREIGRRQGESIGSNQDIVELMLVMARSSDESIDLELRAMADAMRAEAWNEHARNLPSEFFEDGRAGSELQRLVDEDERIAVADLIEAGKGDFDEAMVSLLVQTDVIGGRTRMESIVSAYNDMVPDHVWDQGKDAVQKWVKRVDRNRQLWTEFTPEQWRTLKAARDNLRRTMDVVEETAVQRAMWNVVPFLDDHAQRSMFGEYARNFIPFWYAEENFLKRWGRTLATSPVLAVDQIRKAQLGYMGLKSAGIIRTDVNGRDWVVYPGSGLLTEAVSRTGLLGNALPIGVLFQASTDSLLPGVNEEMGQIAPSPFAAMPVHVLTHIFPDMQDTKRAVLGDIGASSSIIKQFIPTTMNRAWESVFGNEDSSIRYNAAMMTAIANAEARGMGLEDNATAAEADEFLDKMRDHARVIMFSQMIVGYVVPGAPSPIESGEDTWSLDAILGWNVNDNVGALKDVYRELVQNLGIEEGTLEYLATAEWAKLEDIVDPLSLTVSRSSSVSGAPLPATRVGMKWYEEHKQWIDTSPEAGAWFLPPDDEDQNFDYYSYGQQFASGLRERRSPEEFLRAIKYRTAAQTYFDVKDHYEELRRPLGDAQAATRRRLDEEWDNFKDGFLAANPIFAEELQDGRARQRRARTIEQMRLAARDPMAPPSPHLEGIREMVEMFDAYVANRKMLADRRDAEGQRRKRNLIAAMTDQVERWKLRWPDLERLWSSVYEPEARLD